MRGGGERGAEGEGWGLREEEGGREGTGQERGDTKRQMNGWEREGGGGRSAGRKRSGRGVGGGAPCCPPALGKCSNAHRRGLESLPLREPRAATPKWGPRPGGSRDNWLYTQPLSLML